MSKVWGQREQEEGGYKNSEQMSRGRERPWGGATNNQGTLAAMPNLPEQWKEIHSDDFSRMGPNYQGLAC